MLERMLIRSFAIIDNLSIDFKAPFTVLSGETGAGKSMMIDAVSLLLGARAQSEMIRFGEDKAYVEGVFSMVSDQPLQAQLRELGLLDDPEEPLVFSREISENGKNICRINSRTVTLSQYKSLAHGLVDIHGQHDYQVLMQTPAQLGLLDAYGGMEHQARVTQVEELYTAWQKIRRNLEEAHRAQKEQAAQEDYLRFQAQEIDDAQIQVGEAETLAIEIARLSHGEKIQLLLQQAYEQMFDNEDGLSAHQLLSGALHSLKEAQRFDESLAETYAALEPALYILDETARDLRHYQENLELSPLGLEQAENRMHLLRRLFQKYGETEQDVLNWREDVEVKLQQLEQWQSQENQWHQQEQTLEKEYQIAALALSQSRKTISKALEEAVNFELKDLGMGKAVFQVRFQGKEPGLHGIDGVVFMISSNEGEPFLPLAKIASGGELSRITLAMKKVLAATDTCQTLIFDEIDSGIGGVTAHAVGEKLAAISQVQQVICVTHSAAIAARARQHLYINKIEKEGRTLSQIEDLKREARIVELARMLGGDMTSSALLEHARTLVEEHQDQ